MKLVILLQTVMHHQLLKLFNPTQTIKGKNNISLNASVGVAPHTHLTAMSLRLEYYLLMSLKYSFGITRMGNRTNVTQQGVYRPST